MVVYKVVHRRKGKLYSAWMQARLLRTRYRPGKVTKPKAGKIFAFSALVDALKFSRITANYPSEVWLAEADGVEEFSPSVGETSYSMPLRIARQWWAYWIGQFAPPRAGEWRPFPQAQLSVIV